MSSADSCFGASWFSILTVQYFPFKHVPTILSGDFGKRPFSLVRQHAQALDWLDSQFFRSQEVENLIILVVFPIVARLSALIGFITHKHNMIINKCFIISAISFQNTFYQFMARFLKFW
jgi:hypothetical protein